MPAGESLGFEEVRKRKLFAVLIVPGILILLSFGLHHLFNGIWLEGSLDLIACLWLITSLLALRLMKKGLVIYRINTALLGLLFLFLAAKGGTEGNKILWMFSYPLIAFYSLGIIEGLIWTTAIFALSLMLLFLPVSAQWVHGYSSEFKLRFCVAFLLVATMTHIYESVRRKSQSNLENERFHLEVEKRKLAEMAHTLTQSEQRLMQAQSIARVGDFEYEIDTDRFRGSEEALRILDLDRTGGPVTLRDLKARAPDLYAFITSHKRPGGGEGQFHLEPFKQEAMEHPQKVVYAKAERVPSTEGRPEKVIGVIQDITAQYKAEEEKKELEARLVRSQKMEALGLLAGGVAHDLNNVLSGIVSYPDMMLLRLPAGSELRRPLSIMRDTGQKAAAIVQDLLTLARRGVTNFEILNLNDLIDQYLLSPEFEKLKSYHPEAEIKVSKQAHLPNIRGSAIHLVKALMNLVSNAVEALPGDGFVQIGTENRYIGQPFKGYVAVKEGDYVVLSVADNGGGIGPGDLSRIFEPFYTKKKMGRSGTGLGLAVVWGTVEDHHGYVDVASEAGQGTMVELYFPVVGESLRHREQAVRLYDYRGNGERILVVDDMEAQREITSELLAELGYQVEAVISGEAAVEFLRRNTVDLVILDMIMGPGMDGLETYIRVRKLHPDQKTLIVSGFSETGRVKEAQSLGAGAYVKKPFSLETIGLAVRRELNR